MVVTYTSTSFAFAQVLFFFALCHFSMWPSISNNHVISPQPLDVKSLNSFNPAEWCVTRSLIGQQGDKHHCLFRRLSNLLCIHVFWLHSHPRPELNSLQQDPVADIHVSLTPGYREVSLLQVIAVCYQSYSISASATASVAVSTTQATSFSQVAATAASQASAVAVASASVRYLAFFYPISAYSQTLWPVSSKS